ncbi:transcriptional regulator GlxA family with amidase domain [Streptomyces sp. M18.1]
MREETATPAAPHRVAVLVLDDVLPLDLGIPAQVFIAVPGDPYELILCGRTAGSVRTAAGFAVTVAAGLEAVRGADTVVVPGYAPHLRELSADVLAALAGAHARGRRLVSICTGAFALAAAGVLDGRKATTHWKYAHELAARHPRVSVDPRVLYVDEGQVLTSAGVAAGIDLCLHLVRRDLGARTANQVARSLVSAPHRDGGQAQYIERPLAPEAPGVTLASTRAWALARAARATDGPATRRARAPGAADLRPAVRHRDRHDAPAVAAHRPARPRPGAAGEHRARRRPHSRPMRSGQPVEPAPALPARTRDDTHRLSRGVRPDGTAGLRPGARPGDGGRPVGHLTVPGGSDAGNRVPRAVARPARRFPRSGPHSGFSYSDTFDSM